MIKLVLIFFIIVAALLTCNGVRKDTVLVASLQEQMAGNTNHEDFRVYSLPASNKLNIQFRATEAGKAGLRVLFEDGRLVSQRQLSVNKGFNTWELSLPPGISGLVLIQFNNGKIYRTTKIVCSGSAS